MGPLAKTGRCPEEWYASFVVGNDKMDGTNCHHLLVLVTIFSDGQEMKETQLRTSTCRRTRTAQQAKTLHHRLNHAFPAATRISRGPGPRSGQLSEE